jgi:hypothetical protein
VAGLVGLATYLTEFQEHIFGFAFDGYYEHRDTQTLLALSYLLFGGAVYGLFFGPALGLVIGLTIHWTPESKTT